MIDLEDMLKIYYRRNKKNIEKVRKEREFVINNYSKVPKESERSNSDAKVNLLNREHEFFKLNGKEKSESLTKELDIAMKGLNNIKKQSHMTDFHYINLPYYCSYDKSYGVGHHNNGFRRGDQENTQIKELNEINKQRFEDLKQFFENRNEDNEQRFLQLNTKIHQVNNNIDRYIKKANDFNKQVYEKLKKKENVSIRPKKVKKKRSEDEPILRPTLKQTVKKPELVKKKTTTTVITELSDTVTTCKTDQQDLGPNPPKTSIKTSKPGVALKKFQSKVKVVQILLKYFEHLKGKIKLKRKGMIDNYNQNFSKLINVLLSMIKGKYLPIIKKLASDDFSIQIIENFDSVDKYREAYSIDIGVCKNPIDMQENLKETLIKIFDAVLIEESFVSQIKELCELIFKNRVIFPKKFFFDFELERLNFSYYGFCNLEKESKLFMIFNLIYIKVIMGMLFNVDNIFKKKREKYNIQKAKLSVLILGSVMQIIYNRFVLKTLNIVNQPLSTIMEQYKYEGRNKISLLNGTNNTSGKFLQGHLDDDELENFVQKNEEVFSAKMDLLINNFKSVL